MAEEREVNYLHVDAEEIENKLKKVGAKKEFDRVFRIQVFDYPDLRLNNEKAAWLRLRDEGDKIMLAYKQRLGVKNKKGENDDGMLEHQVEVSDFEETKKILFSIGLVPKFYEEKQRIRYTYNDIEFDIDFFPKLDPYLEIEADTWEKVEEGIKLLDLDPKKKRICSTFQILEEEGVNMLEYKEFSFKNGWVKK